MIFRAVLLPALLCLPLLLTGCWDDAEINGRAFVLGFGMDQSDTEGSRDFTFQLAIPVSGDSESSGAIEYTTCTVTEHAAAAAIRTLEKDMGRQINFEQLNLIVIGEDLSHESFTDMTELFFRRASVRRQSCIAVCQGSAKDFLAASPHGSAIASDAAIMLQSYDNAGSADSMAMNLHSLYKTLANADEFYLLRMAAVNPDTLTGEASADTTNDASENRQSMLAISGAAAYGRHGEYLGEMTAHELELMRLLMSRQISGILSVKDEISGTPQYFRVKQSRCSVRCSLKDNVPQFTLRLFVSCMPVDGKGFDRAGTDTTAFVEQAEQQITRELTAEITALADRSRSTLGSSVAGLQDIVRQRLPEWYERSADRWEEIYPTSVITPEVRCTVIGGGITK